jgi:hypothetical protein
MNSVINFFEKKKQFCETVVYVGDFVEWQDYDGELYQGKVLAIQHKPLGGFDFAETMDCFPLWEKEEYTVTLSHGLIVAGDVILRKIVKRTGKRVVVTPTLKMEML